MCTSFIEKKKRQCWIAIKATLFILPMVVSSFGFADDGIAKRTSPKRDFTIIAHRGAPGYLPEHSLESTTLAFAQRPDFIEQDVVITADNIPVVLHDIHLETVSNVASLFPKRHRDDKRYYARDFTLDELRTLTLVERRNYNGKQVFPHRYSGINARFTIATLMEHFELIRELNREFNTNIGVYPEVKSPAFHLSEGVDASKIVIDALDEYGFGGAKGNSYLQCFDLNEVKRIRETLNYTGKVVMLIGENSWAESNTDYDWLRTEEGLKTVAQYANGIGPWIGHLLDEAAYEQGTIKPVNWLAYAHQYQLTIHPYTYRHDALPEGMTGTQLLNTLKDVLNVDGVFTDHIPPVQLWRKQEKESPR